MEIKQSQYYQKWCNDNEILIYPIPLYENGHSYTICVEKKGIARAGKVVFENKGTKEKRSVWDQIRELYKLIYEREKEFNNT